MARFEDLTGKPYGRLTVIERAPNKGKKIMWKCVCNCPEHKEVIVSGDNLRNNHVQSCGCYKREKTAARSTTHGESHSKLHYLWDSMKQRCTNPKNKRYNTYGARGITVCSEWMNSFKAFYDWSMANGFDEESPRGQCTLDRIDNSKGYSPENCRWTTAKEQANNRRSNHLVTLNGETKTLHQWAEEKNIEYKKLWARINQLNWPIEKALNTP